MKIVIYGINFHPEPTGIGKYTGEMAELLIRKGHEVRVITAPPYYPAWQVQQGYSSHRYKKELWHGALILRAPIWIPSKLTGMTRIMHVLSFAFFSFPCILRQIFWKPDLVWVCAPALSCAPAARLLALASRAKSWIHFQDFEVDVAFSTGLIKGELIKKLAFRIEAMLVRSFDVVSSISDSMLHKLAQKGVSSKKLTMLRNWVDVTEICPSTSNTSYRRDLSYSERDIVVLFSGTLAAKQGLQIIPEVARKVEGSHPNVKFLICGDGQMKKGIEELCRGMKNVKILPLQPRARLNELLNTADIHLLPQDQSFADLVMPSKLGPMLASGRPVVTNARPNSELAEVVSSCGSVASMGDANSMAQKIIDLASNENSRKALGKAARHYALENLSIDSVVAAIEAAAKKNK